MPNFNFHSEAPLSGKGEGTDQFCSKKEFRFFASASSFEGNEVRKSFRFGLEEKKVPINLDFEFPKEFKWDDECIVNFLQPAKL